MTDLLESIENLPHDRKFTCEKCGHQQKAYVLTEYADCEKCNHRQRVRWPNALFIETEDFIEAVLSWIGDGETLELAMKRKELLDARKEALHYHWVERNKTAGDRDQTRFKSRKELIEEITGLEGYEFTPWGYQRGHYCLLIHGRNPDRPGHNVHLSFEAVTYMQMPTTLGFARFREGTKEDFEEIFRLTDVPDPAPWQRGQQLYVFENPSVKAYVMSALIHLEYDVPSLW